MLRRQFLGGLAACAAAGLPQVGRTEVRSFPGVDALLDDCLRRTVDYFWQTTEARRGLAPDYWPAPLAASIAAAGFAFTAVVIGVSRGWLGRSGAARRVRGWCEFLAEAPQGPAAQGCAGHRGFFYHFLELDSGTRFRNSELSTVDTALLLMGVRCAARYFDRDDEHETVVRRLAEELTERVDWRWAQQRSGAVAMGWRPESGFIADEWVGYNEALMLYLLALGSERHGLGPDAWTAWTAGYPRSWGSLLGVEHLTFGPLFGHHFTQCWVDLRGIRDEYMRARDLDYFENTRRAALAQRAYAIANPLGWAEYGANLWGLSACDGPLTAVLDYHGQRRQFHDYAGRGVNLDSRINYDDGTITPSAALGCLPFAPELVRPATETMYARHGRSIYGAFGFLDSFNASFGYDVALASGERVGGDGWADTRYYGITQGPVLAMLENHATGMLWRTMRGDPTLRRGLRRAGFRGGWLDSAA